MKKLLTALLVVTIILARAAPVFAAAENGSITINGIGTDATYEVYKLLDLESYDSTSGAYSYKVNPDWTAFAQTDDAKAYITVDEAGYVTWVNGEDDASVAAFAKLALAYAKDNGIAPVQSSTNEGEFVITDSTGKFSNLELGYYLVDSTVGALCGLTTTNPNASINAKNGTPTVDKQVQEDSTSQWGDKNTADVGQTVNFRATISVHAGAENYILHDVMSAGLTFDVNSVKVTHIQTSDGITGDVDPSNFTVVSEGLEDDCTFEVHFNQSFCDGLETNDKLIVYYSAMLNRNAIVAKDGNPNETWLQYGEDHSTTHDTTTTYTFGFDIIKTDSQNTLIDGAEFKIYDSLTGGKEIGVVLMDDGVTYRRARADEEGSSLTVPIVVKDGKVRVVGFDNGTYYLEETVAPEGYNKLTARQKFIIADANLDSVFNGDIYSTGSGVHVVNKTGSMLPETGGFGTTMFILIGGVMVLCAGVVLVSKKRMSKVEE
ncbi:MAG: SpaH/EbpB family LPXTG-anchored major pilin [Oscillospiraceae bacterium]|nr:SpaH/EbpB family LPXTG-anchored major pilin [Oscillospiraceae bacterium]